MGRCVEDAVRAPHAARLAKFRWADKDGNWAEADVKDVSGLEIVR